MRIMTILRATVADGAVFGRVADDELLARRRLGKTHLAVKREQVGSSNATKPENLGPFEYAHLRAPLPKDLKGSEIFPSHAPSQHPDTYFLMVSVQSWRVLIWRSLRVRVDKRVAHHFDSAEARTGM